MSRATVILVAIILCLAEVKPTYVDAKPTYADVDISACRIDIFELFKDKGCRYGLYVPGQKTQDIVDKM